MKKFLYISVLIFFIAPISQAQISNSDPIVEMLDSLDLVSFFKNNKFTTNRNELNIYNFKEDEIPEYSEEEIKKRIEKLDALSPFSLQYNASVKSFIDVYAKKRRNLVSRMLGLSQLYFPMFEEKLAKHNLPLELKYLAIVESALNPTATSRVGAKGLWQFMYRTGLMYGLQANSYVDDRSNPELATEAACRYLKYLHGLYNDWNLALAAYNAGPGNVNKAVRRAGGSTDYWEVRAYMPTETQNYVPAFIAVVYVLTYHKEYNIYPTEPKYFNYEIDSVYVSKNVTFQQISDLINIPVSDIAFLNPMYIKNVIPGSAKPQVLWLPKKYIGEFINNEEKLYASLNTVAKVDTTKPTLEPVNIPSSVDTGVVKIDYVVKKGEYISLIAKRYQVRVTDIMDWNKLTNQTLYVGQKLTLLVRNDALIAARKEESAQAQTHPAVVEQPKIINTPAPAKYKTYTIKSGDTLYKIASKHNVSVADLMKWNNLKSKNILAGAKLKIKIG